MRTVGQHELTRRTGVGHRPQAMPGHHRGLGACRAVTARVSPGHSGPAGREQRCLTRADQRRIEWSHEIPDSGISHRNAGSGPCSGTEAGDISPVFAALEHAAGDFTTLGKDPLHRGSSPPRTHIPILACFWTCQIVTRAQAAASAGLVAKVLPDAAVEVAARM